MSTSRTVAADISRFQLQWAGYFLGTVLLIYIFFQSFVSPIDLSTVVFSLFAYQSTKIFCLVVGIIAGGMFISKFVKLGVTRQKVFAGNMIASGILLLFLLSLIAVITLIELLLFHSLGGVTELFSTLLILGLHSAAYYMAGWLITAGYLRYGGFGMAVFILSGLGVAIVTDMIGDTEQSSLFSDMVEFSTKPIIPYVITLSLLIIITGILIWTGRKVTAHIPIKIK